jgi:hypothetical protein
MWPHDNAMIAAGLARYGHGRAATRIFQGLLDAATYMELRRLPELGRLALQQRAARTGSARASRARRRPRQQRRSARLQPKSIQVPGRQAEPLRHWPVAAPLVSRKR